MEVFRRLSLLLGLEGQGGRQDAQRWEARFLGPNGVQQQLRSLLIQLLQWLSLRSERSAPEGQAADERAGSSVRADEVQAIRNEVLLMQVQRYLKAAGARRSLDIYHFLNAHRSFRALKYDELETLLEEWEELGVLVTQLQHGSDWNLFLPNTRLDDLGAAARLLLRTRPCQDEPSRRPKPKGGQVDLSLPPHRFEAFVEALQTFLADNLSLLDEQRRTSSQSQPQLPIQVTLSFEPLHLHGAGLMALLQLFRRPTPKPDRMD